MTTFRRSTADTGRATAGPALVGVLLAAAGLSLLPATTIATLRHTLAALLAPAQQGVAVVQHAITFDQSEQHPETMHAVHDSTHQATIASLEHRQAELEIALAAALAARDANNTASATPPLLTAHTVSAQVLGCQARLFLPPALVLGAGKRQAVAADALVLEGTLFNDMSPRLLDVGASQAIAVGQLTLAGRRVWGKIVEVGPHTALARHVSDLGYRDLVQLATRSGDQLRPGPRGLLEGCGETHARIRLVETTQAVAVDDIVLAASTTGLLDAPLWYGRIVRVERRAGAPHWDLWMEPAAARHVERVEILRGELNQARAASTLADEATR